MRQPPSRYIPQSLLPTQETGTIMSRYGRGSERSSNEPEVLQRILRTVTVSTHAFLSLLKNQTATVSGRKGTVAGHRYFPAEAPVGMCQQPPVWEQERAGGFCLDDDSPCGNRAVERTEEKTPPALTVAGPHDALERQG